ncbi:sugar phosphate isomerase/epimerase family protein [Dyadobacter aurulentus]|uniref:sugar phosphate isomerase/epimerase family protein n=1 Tax=Dyadobacter sp. UC 10 TaxID=2605428 RepID=UPI0011F1E8C1|nr:TIM barrel protein [Dyadobacter sp. UC 10]KAA0990387.1 TIM barrel protein [Dyadobacter sp. UC 10]
MNIRKPSPKTAAFVVKCIIILLLLPGSSQAQNSIFRKDNLIAWCIVPFDSKNRGPVERAEMLNQLGITMLAYDWREKHIPEFDAEMEALKSHNIKLKAFWLYSGPNPENDKILPIILDVLKRHNIKTEIWCMIAGIKDLDKMSQQEKIEVHAKPLTYIAERAAEIGCKVGVYNHGGWYGNPENQLELIKYVNKPNIGIVYNLHHAEADLETFPQFYPKILPHLLAINLAGLKKGTPVKVLPVGQGDAELEMMRIIQKSSYKGPIGIINEEFAPDAEEGLKINIEGLKKILTELGDRDAVRSYK